MSDIKIKFMKVAIFKNQIFYSEFKYKVMKVQDSNNKFPFKKTICE